MVIMVQGEQARTTAASNGSGTSDGAGMRERAGAALAQAGQLLKGGERNVGSIERVASVLGGLLLVGYALRKRNVSGVVGGVVGAALLQRGTTGHCHLYGAMGMSTAGDAALVQQHGGAAVLDAQKAVKVEHRVTINRPRAELYRYWRNFENLPRIMSHLESVTVLDERRSRWKAKAPAGQTVEWNAELFNEVPDGLIAWRSERGAAVPNAGSVHFSDAANGATEVRVVLDYEPPAGAMGVALAKLWGEEPAQQVKEDLQRFKAAMERQ
jgi:uncharacterized membrane protein